MGADHAGCTYSDFFGISITGPGQRHGSLFVQLLPFIEQQNLYNNCNFTVPTQYYSYIANHPPIVGDTSNKGPMVTAQVIPTLKCPSDDPGPTWGGTRLTTAPRRGRTASTRRHELCREHGEPELRLGTLRREPLLPQRHEQGLNRLHLARACDG